MSPARRYVLSRRGLADLVVYQPTAADAEKLVDERGYVDVGAAREEPLVLPAAAHAEQDPVTGVRRRPI